MTKYFRAVIDFTVLDEDAPITEALEEGAGNEYTDGFLASTLQHAIEAGEIDIDGIDSIELH